jgi:predicted TIM-barrel fold metal-dependent hydrolase
VDGLVAATETLEFFDAYCSYGETASPPHRYAGNVRQLRNELDYCGIRRALVHHAGARFGHPDDWNEVLRNDLWKLDTLIPVFAVLPRSTNEMAIPALTSGAEEKGPRPAFMVFPKEHHFALNRKTMGGFVESLEAARMPLFVKDDILSIDRFLDECPELTVIAVGQGPHSIERYLRPIMESHANLVIETSSYIIDNCLEEICGVFGAGRLVFGSGYPNNCSGGAVWQLLNANLPTASKAAIASGNLERLLGAAK